MGWEVGGRAKREGTYVYLWLIDVDAWQKPTQYCKAIILQLKLNKFKNNLARKVCDKQDEERQTSVYINGWVIGIFKLIILF